MRIIQSEKPRPLNLLAVGPDGRIAGACGTFGTRGGVEAWNATTGERLWVYVQDGWAFRSVTFVLNGSHALTSDFRGASLLDSQGVEAERIGWTEAVVAAADDRAFVGRADANGAALTGWNLPNVKLLWKDDRWEPHTQFHSPPAVDLARSRLAVPILTGGTHPAQFVSVRDAGTGKQLVRLPLDPASPIQQLAFTADGAKLLVRTDDRKVQVFDAATGAAAGELVHPGRPFVTGIAVHPRGPIACARTNGTVTLWDADTREQLRTLDWKAGKLVSVAFSPDGALGAAGTEDGKVIVWDVDL